MAFFNSYVSLLEGKSQSDTESCILVEKYPSTLWYGYCSYQDVQPWNSCRPWLHLKSSQVWGVHHPTLLAMCLVASRQEVSKGLLGQTVPQADTLLTTLQYRFVCRKWRALPTLPKDWSINTHILWLKLPGLKLQSGSEPWMPLRLASTPHPGLVSLPAWWGLKIWDHQTIIPFLEQLETHWRQEASWTFARRSLRLVHSCLWWLWWC